jgi:hypothetical protein
MYHRYFEKLQDTKYLKIRNNTNETRGARIAQSVQQLAMGWTARDFLHMSRLALGTTKPPVQRVLGHSWR